MLSDGIVRHTLILALFLGVARWGGIPTHRLRIRPLHFSCLALCFGFVSAAV